MHSRTPPPSLSLSRFLESNRFMFWHKKGAMTNRSWKPPTSPERMHFREWRQWTREADTNQIGPEDIHYYLTTGECVHACAFASVSCHVASSEKMFAVFAFSGLLA